MKKSPEKIEEDELVREITEEALLSVAHDSASSSEVLQDLAQSDLSSARVREAIASNTACSNKTNLLLCDDEEANVRIALAKKATHVCTPSDISEDGPGKQEALKILRKLAQDTEIAVRETLAEEIKECEYIPAEIAQTLARDVAESVAMPVLEYSPLLEDKDLLEIISTRPTTGVLCAISKRPTVSEDVSDSLIETQNQEVIPSLLRNSNAQIREDALNRIVEGAQNNQTWQEALVARPKLPKSVSKRVAKFISVELINHLYSTGHVDVEGAKHLMGRVKERLSTSRDAADLSDETKPVKKTTSCSLPENEAFMAQAIQSGNFESIYAEVSQRAKLKTVFVRRAIISKNAKVITALCWKAGLSVALAYLIQKSVARIEPQKTIAPGDDGEYPLNPKEMNWHLEVFGANRPCNIM